MWTFSVTGVLVASSQKLGFRPTSVCSTNPAAPPAGSMPSS